MYILECADGSYYVGSTKYLKLRIEQHQSGNGANHTRKRLPVKLVYFEEFERIDWAFYREKQVQKWRREKKEALIYGNKKDLPELARAYRTGVSVNSTPASLGFDELNQGFAELNNVPDELNHASDE